MRPLDDYIKKQLNEHLKKLDDLLTSDMMTIVSPIVPGVEVRIRDAIEKSGKDHESLGIILDTPGGIVEVVERIAETIRYHFSEVLFVVPNLAMSAGTVFVMSGNRIFTDYFSCLGPIDPQIQKDGKLVPALSYLNQFDLLRDYMVREQLLSFIHTKDYF